ncbi:MAG TPA: DUF1566 domain-containing protein [Desulfopila sp.]|nr:DUF1566 domain-containing protein [Desulfopila sp.]
MHHSLKVGNRIVSPIDWEMTPDLSFGTYESWGGRERVRDNKERVYYFFVDNWGDSPKVCLMERAVKHARVLAEVDVPPELVEKCVKSQGAVARFERSFAVDDDVKDWLVRHVLEGEEGHHVKPVVEIHQRENMGEPLPPQGRASDKRNKVTLPSDQVVVDDVQVEQILRHWNVYDSHLNTDGSFVNSLVDAGDGLTVIDERTALQWQSGGIDICSNRTMNKKIKSVNDGNFAGFADWRLPTIEEAMSLMETERNFKGVYLHPCFSIAQPFVFVAAQRKPGGYWFVDYKQGRVFWSSGTIPGGFGRLCRSLQ